MATFAQFASFGPIFSGGTLQGGAKIYHCLVGTTTLKNAYTDRDKAVTVAQPLVADSQGMASAYFDGLYKLLIGTSASTGPTDNILYTYQNWNATDIAPIGEGAAIVAASTLTLGTDGNFFHVTGATGITAISGSQPNIFLVFDSTPTLTNSGTLILAGSANYTCVANDTFQFVNEGSGVWREVSRQNGTLASFPTTIGSVGQSLRVTSANTVTYGAVPMMIQGLTTANNAGDVVNDLDIAVGEATSNDTAYANRVVMALTSSITKQSDVVWAVGTGAGGLDTGAVGNSDYYIWLIMRVDTAVVDVLYSLSSTAPSMPTNYTKKRLIGWFKRVGGTIVLFHTYEADGGSLDMNWDAPTLDVNLNNTLTTARRTDAVKVPLNFSTIATINVEIDDATTVNTINISCPDQTDVAPSSTVAPLGSALAQNAQSYQFTMQVRTSATGTIAARSTLATVDNYRVVTVGFRWARRN